MKVKKGWNLRNKKRIKKRWNKVLKHKNRQRIGENDYKLMDKNLDLLKNSKQMSKDCNSYGMFSSGVTSRALTMDLIRNKYLKPSEQVSNQSNQQFVNKSSQTSDTQIVEGSVDSDENQSQFNDNIFKINNDFNNYSQQEFNNSPEFNNILNTPLVSVHVNYESKNREISENSEQIISQNKEYISKNSENQSLDQISGDSNPSKTISAEEMNQKLEQVFKRAMDQLSHDFEKTSRLHSSPLSECRKTLQSLAKSHGSPLSRDWIQSIIDLRKENNI